MTDRHAGYVIALEKDIRCDDAEETIAAIKQIRGVLSVEPVIGDPGTQIGEMRARGELARAFFEFYEKLTGRNS